ncbi:MAG: four helix bundle protein [Verrucomicrobiota bacterium]
MKRNAAFDLDDRLVDFAVEVIDVVESLPETRAGRHVAGQLVRSGTSPAPNYGEAQSAESQRDFVRKMKVSLKELRETMVWLKIIRKRKMWNHKQLEEVIRECNELISIFVASVKTAAAKL